MTIAAIIAAVGVLFYGLGKLIEADGRNVHERWYRKHVVVQHLHHSHEKDN